MSEFFIFLWYIVAFIQILIHWITVCHLICHLLEALPYIAKQHWSYFRIITVFRGCLNFLLFLYTYSFYWNINNWITVCHFICHLLEALPYIVKQHWSDFRIITVFRGCLNFLLFLCTCSFYSNINILNHCLPFHLSSFGSITLYSKTTLVRF